MSPLVVAPGGPLVGRIRVPGDKSISHRVLMLAALADGTSTVRGLSDGGDVACTRRIIEALGQIKGYYDYGIFQAIQIASIIGLRHCGDLVKEQALHYQ